MPDAAARSHFHLSREFTWGHIMSTLILLAGLIGIYTDNIRQHEEADKRITVAEARIHDQQESSQRINQAMEKRLQSIDQKLDRLIERELNKGRHP